MPFNPPINDMTPLSPEWWAEYWRARREVLSLLSHDRPMPNPGLTVQILEESDQ